MPAAGVSDNSELSSAPAGGHRVAAIVLAAGTSSRMGSNKLVADFRGEPLIRASLRNVRAAAAVDRIVVVTGHDQGRVAALVSDFGVQLAHNSKFATGLSSSLREGVKAAGDADAVLICLADMPLVKPATIGKVIAAFNPLEHRSIIVPAHRGQSGNPVLWGRTLFPRLMALEGDRGGRSLIVALKSEVAEIAVDDPGILADADTPEALAEMLKAFP